MKLGARYSRPILLVAVLSCLMLVAEVALASYECFETEDCVTCIFFGPDGTSRGYISNCWPKV